ncbi:GTPase HflX [Candidatus Gracilibacteria bacterium]|nr:GTPase HflX [Candidatus Gracilibacteria bacterium]
MRAILIDVIEPATSKEKAEKRLEELRSLMSTYGGLSPVSIIQKKSHPDYETYIGKGKVEEIAALAEQHEANILIVNNLLKPRQIYNLNEALKDQKIETWDRVDLILKIFSKHAQTSEAQLQIELASIRHMGPRIFDMGRELMQQGGAVGLRSGQGETNIEMMKRHLKTHELSIKKKLAHYDQVRAGHREQRRRKGLKTAALVGYTNAGKSALLNALTNKGAYSANELFATLDTRIGKLYIPAAAREDGQYQPGQEVLISDTIGFIQDLPPELIQAFKSTLAETVEADLLLHVIDMADPEIHEKIQVVEDILSDLGLADKPQIYIFNKLDLIAHQNVFAAPPEETPKYSLMKAGPETAISLGWIDHEIKNKKARAHMLALAKKYATKNPLFISAVSGLGIEKLVGELG